MMTKKEYLLQLLQEECAEVIQIASKYNRFGADSFHPDDPAQRKNRELLAKEIVDIMATVELIGGLDMLPPLTPSECSKAIDTKHAKVEKYMQISRNIGILEQEPLEVVEEEQQKATD